MTDEHALLMEAASLLGINTDDPSDSTELIDESDPAWNERMLHLRAGLLNLPETKTLTLNLIQPTVASLVTFGDRPGDTVGNGGVFLTMNSSEHEALGSPTRLTVVAEP